MDVHTHVGRTRPFLVEWFAAAGDGLRVLRAVGRRLIVRARAREYCRRGVAFVCATVTALTVGGKGGVGSMESGGACAKRRFNGHARRRLVATTRTRTGLCGRHSLLLTTRRRRRYAEGKTGCGVSLSHSFQWRRGRTTDRRRRIGTTFHARRVVSAPRPSDSGGCAADGRPAGQPSSHRFASASDRRRRPRDGFFTTRARCTPAADAAAGSQFVPRRRSSFEKYYVSRRRPFSLSLSLSLSAKDRSYY